MPPRPPRLHRSGPSNPMAAGRYAFLSEHPGFYFYSDNPRSCHHILTNDDGSISPGTYAIFDVGPTHDGATVEVIARGKKENDLVWDPSIKAFFVRLPPGRDSIMMTRYKIYDTTIVDEQSIIDALRVKDIEHPLTRSWDPMENKYV